ncbi:beta-1,3-galactosyl-O-glycosyl-glycoprotein beta-1,6-N-acetylglucosaminyltransferase isoform X3 [Bubalus kerabau]|uniref:beta-1,3-galactosyl-O-glycosyl-glycoprotein beta-1,6-N-acetylglucosaminyltransferase isoform X3 n=1 Tax=Bubalus carabanensis TaxID=3119969 RepID=UPI00244E6BD4|nr:beta-1,3-galactosyl-O-glycosyl-glycoprotein beta-1,6-N-acetylglucosaminyltransferase isoform X3 [Bubalus carabanensis]
MSAKQGCAGRGLEGRAQGRGARARGWAARDPAARSSGAEFSQPSAEQRRARSSPCCPAASSVFRARHSLQKMRAAAAGSVVKQLCSWIPSKTQAPQPATHFSSFSVDDRSPVHPGWALRAARLEEEREMDLTFPSLSEETRGHDSISTLDVLFLA